jgi:outer membrane receptor for ferrienterochelin and colicin
MTKTTLEIFGAGQRTAILATALTMAMTTAVSAQTMLDTISVYADRSPRQVLDLAQNVTVIGRQEIEERMVRDIQDLVRYEPGISPKPLRAPIHSAISPGSPFVAFPTTACRCSSTAPA